MRQSKTDTPRRNKRALAGIPLVGLAALGLGLLIPTSTPAQENDAGVTVEVRVLTASGEQRTVHLTRPDGAVWDDVGFDDFAGGLLGERRLGGWSCQPVTGIASEIGEYDARFAGDFEIRCNLVTRAKRSVGQVGLRVGCASPELRTGIFYLYSAPTSDNPAPSRAGSIAFRCSNAAR